MAAAFAVRGSDSAPRNTSHDGVFRGKVFFIGPGKTGTRTLQRYMSEHRGCTACHHRCDDDHLWGPDSVKKSWNHSAYDKYCAFLDGFRPDYHFLENEYSNGNTRFAYNSRPMQSWLQSRAHHLLRDKYHLKIGNNSKKYNPAAVQKAVCKAATQLVKHAKYLEGVLAFFNATNQRRQRFAFIDVITYSGHGLAAVLKWLTRPKVEKVDGEAPLLLTPNDLPEAWRIDPALQSASTFEHVGDRLKNDSGNGIGRKQRGNEEMVMQAVVYVLNEWLKCPESSWNAVWSIPACPNMRIIDGKGGEMTESCQRVFSKANLG